MRATRRLLDAGSALAEARATAATLAGDVTKLRHQLALTQADAAEVLAYARATVAAARRGDPGAVEILAGLLEERGALPPAGLPPSALLAQAYRGVTL